MVQKSATVSTAVQAVSRSQLQLLCSPWQENHFCCIPVRYCFNTETTMSKLFDQPQNDKGLQPTKSGWTRCPETHSASPSKKCQTIFEFSRKIGRFVYQCIVLSTSSLASLFSPRCMPSRIKFGLQNMSFRYPLCFRIMKARFDGTVWS